MKSEGTAKLENGLIPEIYDIKEIVGLDNISHDN